MKKFLASASLIVLGSVVLSPANVSAADLPMSYKSPAPVIAPAFSWTGCYIGVHAGGGVMHDNFTEGAHGSGGLAGGQAGCNYQDGNWVFGGEAEGYWSGMKGTNAFSQSEGPDFGRVQSDATNKWDFSIAARAGVAFDRTFVYGKAGWVWGKFDFLHTDSSDCCSTNGGPSLSTFAGSGTLDGLLLGVGVEHAITRNWTVKLEYNFLKYGSKELNFVSCSNENTPACFPGSITSTVQADKHIFKIGANYLFNMGGAPLVAKY